MSDLSIWNSKKPKSSTELEWTKQLMNELLDIQIQREKADLEKSTNANLLNSLKVAEIKKIEVESFKSFPGGYEYDYGRWAKYDSKEKIDSICKKGIDHANSILESAKVQREKNRDAISNNKAIIEGICAMMEKFGIKRSYSEYTYPSPRSRTKKWIDKNCEWPHEVSKFISTNDGFESIERNYNSQLATIERWKEQKMKELFVIERQKRNDEIEKQKNRALASFQVKYDLPSTSEWYQIYCHADENGLEQDLIEISKYYNED